MIRHLVLVAALVAASVCKADGPKVSRQTSPAGIDYTLLEMPEEQNVTIQIAWSTDWDHRPETNKAAPLVGRQLMLSGGAEGYPAGEMEERIVDLNLKWSIYLADPENMIGEFAFPREHLDEVIEVANAHLSRPKFDQNLLAPVRNQVAQQVHRSVYAIYAERLQTLNWSVFGDAPLRKSLLPIDLRLFDELTRQDVVSWHQDVFSLSPEAIAIAGGIGPDEAGSAIDELLEGLPDGGNPVEPVVEFDFTPKRILLHKPNIPFALMGFYARLPLRKPENELEDTLLVQALDSAFSIVEIIDVERHDDYKVSIDELEAQLLGTIREDYTFFTISVRVTPERLAELEETVLKVYSDFRKEDPPEALDEWKALTAETVADFSEDLSFLALTELQATLYGYPAGRSLRMGEELEAITKENLKTRLRDAYPKAEDFIVIAISDDPDALPGACVIQTPAEAVDCP